jgi:hypothetical protein
MALAEKGDTMMGMARYKAMRLIELMGPKRLNRGAGTDYWFY